MNRNKVEKSDLIGEIKGFPIDIVQAMISEQIRQGNKPNVKLFQYDKHCCWFGGGFDWDASILGSDVWVDILLHSNWEMFYKNKNKLIPIIEDENTIKNEKEKVSKVENKEKCLDQNSSNFYKSFISFKNFLNDRNLPFMILGSLALKVCGFDLEPNDIDVEVICSIEDEKIFKVLEDSQKEKQNNNNSYPKDKNLYIFSYRGIIINVWCQRKKFSYTSFVLKNNVKYATVIDTLKTKMSYQRTKDFKQVLKIFQDIINISLK